MESQQPLGLDHTENDDRDALLDEDEGEDWVEEYIPVPEFVVNDANHDQVITLLAVCVGVGALVLMLSIGYLDTLGIFGSNCPPNHTRTGMCTVQEVRDFTYSSPYIQTPSLPRLDLSPQ